MSNPLRRCHDELEAAENDWFEGSDLPMRKWFSDWCLFLKADLKARCEEIEKTGSNTFPIDPSIINAKREFGR